MKSEDTKRPIRACSGDTGRSAPKPGGQASLPLRGQRIVVTRAREQAAELSEQLAARGAEVLEIPTITPYVAVSPYIDG